MTVVVNRRADFTLDNFRRVAFGREGVEIGPLARDAMAAARRGFLALLDSDRTAFIYGITTRPGVEVATAVPPEQQREHARLFRAESGYGFGGGCHSEQVVRGMVFARLVDFVEGHGKVRPEFAERVAALLGGPLPCVPLDGQAGPGEVLPMLYLAGWIGDLDFEEGEGMALVNGSPYSTAVLADTAVRARNRLAQAEALFALSADAFRAPLEAYDEALDDLWADQYQARGAPRAPRPPGRRRHIGPPQPPGAGELPDHAEAARRGPAGRRGGGAGGGRRAPLGLGEPGVLPAGPRPSARADGVQRRVPQRGRRAPRSSRCRPAGRNSPWPPSARSPASTGDPRTGSPTCCPRPGTAGALGGATNHFGWAATSYVETARAAASPALMPAVVVDPQNDLSTATCIAHQKERDAAGAFDGVLAILALVASQALFVTGRQPAPPLHDLAAGIRSVFPPVESPHGRDLGAQAGRLADIFRAASVTGRLDFP